MSGRQAVERQQVDVLEHDGAEPALCVQLDLKEIQLAWRDCLYRRRQPMQGRVKTNKCSKSCRFVAEINQSKN